jgi:hypothetical protein
VKVTNFLHLLVSSRNGKAIPAHSTSDVIQRYRKAFILLFLSVLFSYHYYIIIISTIIVIVAAVEVM